MIIEIKDLPEGRKVSRISVDIAFEDSVDSDDSSKISSYESTKKIDRVTESNPGVVSVIEPNEHMSIDNSAPYDTQIKDNFEDRKPKEIPSEMLDLEL